MVRLVLAAVFALTTPAAASLLRGPDGGMPLDKVVLARASDQLVVAKVANLESQGNAKQMAATQQQLVADLARNAAEDAFDVARPSVPETKKQEIEANVYALKAQKYADHANMEAEKAHHIAEDAAKKAAAAIEAQLKQDAYDAAEKAGSMQAEDKETRDNKMVNAVAGAVEPYHIAQLRMQKNVEELYWKAKSAQKNAIKLADQANTLATKAQGLQATGSTISAQQLMSMAHGTMQAALNMKGWAAKLYNEANTVSNSIGYYQMAQGQAAAAVAMTKIIDAPPVLPALLQIDGAARKLDEAAAKFGVKGSEGFVAPR